MNLIGMIREDVRAKARWLYGSDATASVLKAWCTDGTAAMFWYRLMQWAQSHRLGLLAMLCNKVNAICCRCIIGRGAQFGERFVLVHSAGVVINAAVRGGSGIHLEHQVTIGAEKGEAPVLGDGVFVGAGARIIGTVKVGDRARVGANAVVVRDVPADCTAVGVPAEVKQRGEVVVSDVQSC